MVDLDGTLIKTDLLVESVNMLLVQKTTLIFEFLFKLIKSRAGLKAWLATKVQIDVGNLPYNMDLINWLICQKSSGRKIILATASNILLAERVANHLNIFDEVIASDMNINCKSYVKRNAIVERYGINGYDYIGNDYADIAVWEASANVYVVSNNKNLLNKINKFTKIKNNFSRSNDGAVKVWLKALRSHQWAKNLLIFAPLLTAHNTVELISVVNGAIAFVLFSIAASSVYLLNDLFDIQSDRRHPIKHTRPIAAGEIKIIQAWFVWPLMMILSLGLSNLFLPTKFTIMLIIYIVLTLIYSAVLKKIVILDVVILSMLYTLRIIAGAYAELLTVSFWILLFSIFIFFSLALIKRFNEIKTMKKEGREIIGRGYTIKDLEYISAAGIASGFISVLILALYLQDPKTIDIYANIKVLWMLCPLMLYWISRSWLIAYRGKMSEDPILFAISDRVSLIVGSTMVFTVIIAKIPHLI